MTRDRLVDLMDHTECRIAVTFCLNDNTHGKQVIDLIQPLVLCDHLLIDTEIMFGTSIDRCLDTRLLNMMADLVNDLADQDIALFLAIGNA